MRVDLKEDLQEPDRSAGYRLDTPEEPSWIKVGSEDVRKKGDRGGVSHRDSKMKQTFPPFFFPSGPHQLQIRSKPGKASLRPAQDQPPPLSGQLARFGGFR